MLRYATEGKEGKTNNGTKNQGEEEEETEEDEEEEEEGEEMKPDLMIGLTLDRRYCIQDAEEFAHNLVSANPMRYLESSVYVVSRKGKKQRDLIPVLDACCDQGNQPSTAST